MLHKLITGLVLAAGCSSSGASTVSGDGGAGGKRDPNGVGAMGSDAGADAAAAAQTFPTCASLGWDADAWAGWNGGDLAWHTSCGGRAVGPFLCTFCILRGKPGPLLGEPPPHPPAPCTPPSVSGYLSPRQNPPPGCDGYLCVDDCTSCPAIEAGASVCGGRP